MKKSWNPVLNKFIEIKNAYIDQFGEENLYSYNKEEETSLEYWVRMLNIKEYTDLIDKLQFSEHEDVLLIRYANFSKIYANDKNDDINLESTDNTPQDFWDLHNGFYRECRSVTIDIKNNELVHTPFRKFKNLNEDEENSLENIQEKIKNASCIEISNKLDGSMQSARFYKGRILMAGSQAINPNNSWRLTDGYRMLQNSTNLQKMITEHPDETFIFEYISLKDAHVVKYKKEQEGLYLIGIRNVNTGREYSYSEIKEYAIAYNIPMTEIFHKTFEDVLKELDTKRSDEAEGFVINIDGYKLKIKYNDYVKMHRIFSVLSAPNLLIHSIADGNYDDFISKVPEAYRERVLDVSKDIFTYISKIESIIEYYYKIAPKEDRKSFMIYVDEYVPKECKGYIRSKYLGKEYNILKTSNIHYKNNNDIQNFLKKEIDTNFTNTKDELEYE